MEIWGCDRVVSFGDAVNDIPMFEISDECYAVENAVDELKEIASGVIACNEDDGVAEWLSQNALTEGGISHGISAGKNIYRRRLL